MASKRNKINSLRDIPDHLTRFSPVSALELLFMFLVVFSPVLSFTGPLFSAESPPQSPPQKDTGDGNSPADGSSSLTTLSILPFEVPESEEKDLGERMAEELQIPLSESGRFHILTRTELTLEQRDRLFALQAQQGKIEDRATFERLSCEEAFVSGKVRRVNDEGFVVFLDVISLTSGEKIMALRADCWHENAFRRLARAFTREIVNRVDITGSVVKVAGEKYFVEIKRGPEGVNKGDLLAVRHVSRTVESSSKKIDQGEEEPFTTLEVETVTDSNHLRCVCKEGGKKEEKPKEGDLVRLIPVQPAEERKPVVAVLPFTFTSLGSEGGDEDPASFATLVTEELLVTGATLQDAKMVNPAGSAKYADGLVDGRVVCDDLGVDAVLKGRFVVSGKELRVYPHLVLHPQCEVYDKKQEVGESTLPKCAVVTLEEEGKLTPQAAVAAAAAVVKAFKD